MAARRGIIFDLDGTLWNATGMTTRIWNDVMAGQGIALRVTVEDVRRQMGRTMAEIGASLFPELPAGEQARLMALCSDAEVARMGESGTRLYPGLEAALEALRGEYALSIVSNCQEGYARGFIEVCGLQGYFSDYEESGRTGLGKADNIRLVMARGGLERAVYVGDTEGDERAARQAGLPFIFAAYGFGAAKAPDATIDGLPELPGAAERLLSQVR